MAKKPMSVRVGFRARKSEAADAARLARTLECSESEVWRQGLVLLVEREQRKKVAAGSVAEIERRMTAAHGAAELAEKLGVDRG